MLCLCKLSEAHGRLPIPFVLQLAGMIITDGMNYS